MRHFYITGTSRGIGSALATYFLEMGDKVTGISRTKSIEHVNYRHIYQDLSQQNVSEFQLDTDASEIILINNAAKLGTVKRFSESTDSEFHEIFQLNVFTPLQLMKHFSNSVQGHQRLRILNISSGAANRPIPSWMNYCASKAALDMSSEVFYLEEKERNRSVQVLLISPGVVDTVMQQEIRASCKDDFSSHQLFSGLKSNNELVSTHVIARKLSKVLQNTEPIFKKILLKEIEI